MKDPRDIILAPVVSEKSYALIEQGVYTFKVHPSASKPEIHDAVEAIWGVEVVKVNTLNRKGKRRRTRRHQPHRHQARHQAGDRHPGSGRDPAVRELRSPWVSAPASRPAPARRFQTVSDFSEITKTTPEKSLLAPKPKTGGRNAYGRKTSRHRGGGHKQQYRLVDFKRVKDGVTAKVAAIEYDPNRTCRIALLHYADGEKAYILAPQGLDGRRPRDERPGLRHQAGQRPAAALHPGRHHRAQRRAAPGPGRQDRPLGRHRRPARRQGRRLRHPAHAVHRDAPRA